MSFLKNLFGGAKKAIRAEAGKLRAEFHVQIGATESQIRRDIAAAEARLKVAFAQMLRDAKAEAPVVVADVVKAAEEQPKA